jgi:DNA-directed RNA polymerase subunit omega
MEKKSKIQLTNEEMRSKFKSNFELVNYAIKLAENMIKTGRDARVKSEVQNRAMLILEEILEGKDQFDEIKTSSSTSSEMEEALPSQAMVFEERIDRRKYHTTEGYGSEE